MELEELAAQVKAREPGAVLELWEAVRRFVEMKARDRARAGSRVPLEDLTQAGFLAVLDAAEQYDPDRENASFLYMDRSTVFNHTRRIFTAMLPVAFGPEFEEKPKPPKGRIKPSPRKRTPQHRRAFFALLDDVSRIAYTYREQETAQEAPGDRQETASRAGEG